MLHLLRVEGIDLVERLKIPGKDGQPRQVYRSVSGSYCLTYAGGETTWNEVNAALKAGLIKRTHPSESDLWSLVT